MKESPCSAVYFVVLKGQAVLWKTLLGNPAIISVYTSQLLLLFVNRTGEVEGWGLGGAGQERLQEGSGAGNRGREGRPLPLPAGRLVCLFSIAAGPGWHLLLRMLTATPFPKAALKLYLRLQLPVLDFKNPFYCDTKLRCVLGASTVYVIKIRMFSLADFPQCHQNVH